MNRLKLRFFLWLRRVVLAFFAWNTRNLVRFSVRRAGRFRQLGHWKKGSDEIFGVSGLQPSDLDDPALALAKLRKKFEDIGPDLQVIFLIQLCTFLIDEGRQNLVAALFELDAGIEPGDLAHPERLSQRLRERTRELEPTLAHVYVFMLANSLGMASRTTDELAVIEAHLGVQPTDYPNPERLRSLLGSPPEGVLPDLWVAAVQALAASLGKSGRRTEVVAVLQAALGIERADYASPQVLRSKMRAFRGPVAQELSVGSLTLLSTGLRHIGYEAEALALVEADFDLEPADYRDTRLLAAKLRARAQRLPPEMVSLLLMPLYGALAFSGRAEDAAAVLAADAGFDLSADPVELTAALQRRCRTMPEDGIGIYLGTAALILATAGRPRAAVAALEADADLQGVDWRDADALADAVHERVGELSPTARLHYVVQLLSALEEAGQRERASLLADAYVRKLLPLHREETSDLAPMSCILFDCWLGYWSRDGSRTPLEVCRTMMPALRRALAAQGVTLRDREHFIRDVGDLRRRIVQTGLFWAARESDPMKATDLRRTVLLWDLELAQRLLVERFLLTGIRPVPAGMLPGTGWPLAGAPPETERYLPEAGAISAAVGVLGKTDAAA